MSNATARGDSILMLALGSIKQDVLNPDLCEGSAMTSRANRRANDPAALSAADKKPWPFGTGGWSS